MHKEPPKFSNTPSKIKKITVKNRNKQNKLFSKIIYKSITDVGKMHKVTYLQKSSSCTLATKFAIKKMEYK